MHRLHQAKFGALLALMLTGIMTGCASVPMNYTSAQFVVGSPPPQRREAAPPRPGSEFVWINGYWARSNDDYEWVPGQWERPPQERGRWQQGQWRQHGRKGWYWTPGRWR